MKQKITNLLSSKPSYFKWGATRIAQKFNCSERTVKSVLGKLSLEREVYLSSLKK